MLIVSGIALVVLVIGPGAVLSKWYWGYWFSRPQPYSDIINATQITGFAPVHLNIDGKTGARSLVHSPQHTLHAQMQSRGREGGYYDLETRILAALLDRGHDWKLAPLLAPELMGQLHPLAAATGELDLRLFLQPMDPSILLRGYAMTVDSADGEQLLVMALRGGQVTNDHYPYYEFVYELKAGEQPALLDVNKFYYDVAGIEHMEWHTISKALLVPVIALVTFVSLICAIVRWVLRRRRKANHCSRCGYELRGLPHRTCPECGLDNDSLTAAASASR